MITLKDYIVALIEFTCTLPSFPDDESMRRGYIRGLEDALELLKDAKQGKWIVL